MTRKEKEKIEASLVNLTDEEIKEAYFNILYECLGSEAEIMLERGYEESDIKERRRYEKFIQEKCDIIENYGSNVRNIDFFEK